VLAEQYLPGVTVILTPATRRIGALLRARDLDVEALLATVDRLRRMVEDPDSYGTRVQAAKETDG
jgi:hypothetical protein